MAFDRDVEDAYPRRWIGKVTVETTDGRTLRAQVDEPKGDPGNTLSRRELEDKALGLAAFASAAFLPSGLAVFDTTCRVGSLATITAWDAGFLLTMGSTCGLAEAFTATNGLLPGAAVALVAEFAVAGFAVSGLAVAGFAVAVAAGLAG